MSSTATFEALFRLEATGVDIRLKPMASARRMRLRVDPRSGAVLLTYPKRLSRKQALGWAVEQRDWIAAAVADVPAPIALLPGAEIPLRGETHRIEAGGPRRVEAADGIIRVGGPRELIESRLRRWLKAEALALLERDTGEFAARAGVAVSRVGVGDPVSRWGSCAASGAIRYSWRLILAPDWVRRATVAHEVAHRVHMNHGPAFHALAAELLGVDPKPAREWLKRHGAALHRIGR